MSLIEFITFIAAMLFLVISGRNKRQRGNYEDIDIEEKEQSDRLKEFLQSVNHDMKDLKTPVKQPLRPTQAQNLVHQKLDKQKPKPAKAAKALEHPPTEMKNINPYAQKSLPDISEKDAYAHVKQKKSRVYNLIRHQNLQEMILLHEIIGPPKGL